MSSFYNKNLSLSPSNGKAYPARISGNNEAGNINRRLFRSFRSTKNDMCPDCKEKGIIICDTSEGTQICNGCGLVVESNILSEEQEWRNFSNDGQSKGNDRNRVGEVSDIWLENNLTSTTFIKSSKKLQHLNMMTQINKNDQTLLSAFNILKLICETFFLRSNVIERAKEITKELQDMEQLKNRINNLNMLAVVYLACREAGHIKSIKELITFDRSYKEKDLGKTINKLKKVLPSRAFVYNENISHLIYSLSNRLQLSTDLIEAIEYVVKKATTLITTSHRLNSLCGGSIHLIVELNTSEEKNVKLPHLSQIASVCGVTTNTLKTTFKELLAASEYILPKNYLKDNNTKLVILKHKYLHDDKKKRR
ncbi:transcription initiation factor TFIIB, putative [Plasmodium chabaudi chabaudi]|uniref:General transcription factor TFIIB n=2 Tax=Plasmodium chabaudi TaxID=5825 RepID=A0A077TGD3_PLACU|nr:transcription initiation factor TFIIB, putative [Plasmodium chabaudi chabaudi]SCL96071.1 transcription initiation factor TFIIB, putative [Plasmodium chabaudi chabaudi]SCL96361.1 transcription initiation factor TFIIB, putative [Plasmodium chabaudi chabaudi]SCM03494.1 transcription initiation factor TFIIB, putative [Plasmodium chabaudi adami]VTZ66790.1 transcription initiation factor TFIIB, putative [Plasmodium chabaudi chabaudi]|eukprot:XP_016653059.1 transcription initiation factor TFIIB, putative [Plasmodium chabaudi chabaudi]